MFTPKMVATRPPPGAGIDEPAASASSPKFGKSYNAINVGAAGLLEFSSGESGRLHALAAVLPWRAAADTPEDTGEMRGVAESELLRDDVELVVGLRQETLDDFNPDPRRVLLYAHPCLAPEQIRELSTR